jgi:DNA-binding transcriptional LysR family regulator
MKLRHLNIFIVVCEEMNMTKAAERLYMSQPSVSQVVMELESHYQSKLFERLSRKIYLTDAGRELLTYAYHIRGLNEELEEKMKNRTLNPTIKLGATITIGTYMMPKLLKQIKARESNIRVESYIENTEEIERELLKSKLDLAIVEGRMRSPDLVIRPFFTDRLVVVCHKDHDLAQQSNISVEDLRDQGFLVREEGSGSRKLFMEEMGRLGIPFSIVGTFNNTEAIKNGAKYSLGLGVVSKLSIDDLDMDLCMLEIEGLRLDRDFSVVYHKNKYINRQLEALIAYAMV